MANEPKIRRGYRQLKSPVEQVNFCERVGSALTALVETAIITDAVWMENPDLLRTFCTVVVVLRKAYHTALNGGKNEIMDRDNIWQKAMGLLDEIALDLEAASVRNPAILPNSGFDTTKGQRKSPSKKRMPLTASAEFQVVNTGVSRQAIGSASPVPGAYNSEIHRCRSNPSVEANWFHQGIHADPSHMLMENLDLGDTFFRVRHHGPDGPGPWSVIVSTTIT